MHHQIDYTDHAQMLLNPLIEAELRFGKARSHGLEILLKKSHGRINGWIGYTLSRAIREIQDINENAPYPAAWDRPHNLSLFLACDLTSRLNLSASWIYMTGSALSTPSGFYYYNGYSVPIYTEKNNDRLPDYHRLDLSLMIDLNKMDSKFDHNLLISVYNLYNRKNTIAINFNKIITDDGSIRIPSDMSESEIVPTQMYLFGFIPSITYNFRF